MSQRDARPRVIVNFAITADGKVSTRNFTPSHFTSETDKRRLLEIRALGDAVLVGKNTIAADTMSLGLPSPALRRKRRAEGRLEYPLRVIVTASNRFPTKLNVFSSEGGPLRIFTTNAMPVTTRKRIETIPGAKVILLEPFTLKKLLYALRRDDDVRTVVCEGGPTLLRSLAEEGCVDELRVTIAPCVFGGADAPSMTGLASDFLPSGLRFRLAEVESMDDECYLRYLRVGGNV